MRDAAKTWRLLFALTAVLLAVSVCSLWRVQDLTAVSIDAGTEALLADDTPGTGTLCVLSSAPAVLPDGWMRCEGQLLAAEEHEHLFALLGRQFSHAGDAEGTFRLPDYRGMSTLRMDTGLLLDALLFTFRGPVDVAGLSVGHDGVPTRDGFHRHELVWVMCVW